jgi:hypothetical protein
VFASHTRLGEAQAHRTLVNNPDPAHLVRVARLQALITYVAGSFTLPVTPTRIAIEPKEALGGRHFAVEFGNEIRADFQCLAGASLCELGEEFAALRIACPHEFDRLTLDVGEFFGPALL